MAKKSTAIKQKNQGNGDLMELQGMELDAGAGLENAQQEDFQMPFLKVMQALSPQLKKRDTKYVSGLEEGMILNSVTGEFWESKTGVIVLPVSFMHDIVEWSADKRGVLVTVHDRDKAPIPFSKNDKNENLLENGNILKPTAHHYVLLADPENPAITERAVVAMSGSALKISKRWNSMISSIVKVKSDGKPFSPPSYSHFYRLTTAIEKNEKGEWWNWVVSNEGSLKNTPQHKELFDTAKQYHRAQISGSLKSRMIEENGEDISEDVM